MAADPRATILDAAMRCLARDGYDKVRLRDVSRASGVSIGSIQHHFETRDALLDEAMSAVSERLVGRWSGTDADASPWARVAGIVEEVARTADLRRRCAVYTQLCVVAYRVPAQQDAAARIHDAWRSHLLRAATAGVESGTFDPPLPVEHAVDAVLALIDGFELEMTAGTVPAEPGTFTGLALPAIAALLGYHGELLAETAAAPTA